MDLGLEGVHVVVTGASGGIGLEIVETFRKQGALVTAQYNSNPKPLEVRFGRDDAVQPLQCDLTDEIGVEKLFNNACASKFGPAQILVINHAIFTINAVSLWDMSLDQWKRTIDANLTSTFLVAREFLRQVASPTFPEEKKDKISLVMVGSTSGKIGEAGHADYSASKSAMMYGLTMSLKNEIVKIASAGRVNTVAPGWVKTPIVEEAFKYPTIAYAALATTPLKKIATTQDVANQIVILSSNKVSGHVTGQVLMVEGGIEGRVLNTPQELGLEMP